QAKDFAPVSTDQESLCGCREANGGGTVEIEKVWADKLGRRRIGCGGKGLPISAWNRDLQSWRWVAEMLTARAHYHLVIRHGDVTGKHVLPRHQHLKIL